MTRPVTRPVAVVGRYRGTVDLLAQLLGFPEAVHRAGLDLDGRDAVVQAVDRAAHTGVVVVTVAPGDEALALVTPRVSADRIVAVTWHPDDEVPPTPPGSVVLTAGSIHDGLDAAVRARLGHR